MSLAGSRRLNKYETLSKRFIKFLEGTDHGFTKQR
jgi:hypothetical protein